MYYKIPATVAGTLGLTSTLIRHPDGAYLATRAVMARIHPDIEEALRISGGIALTPDQARDDQMKRAHYPLPGSAGEEGQENAQDPGNPASGAADTPGTGEDPGTGDDPGQVLQPPVQEAVENTGAPES